MFLNSYYDMRKIITQCLFLLVTCAVMSSCGLVMEENISKSTMIVYTPADSFVTTNYSVYFKWEPVTNATKYRIQVVSPSFTAINTFAFDTVITGLTSVNLTLSPGTYQWRIRAENDGSYTEYVTRTCIVNIGKYSNQMVSLKSPAAEYVSYTNTVDLTWDTLYSTLKYTVLVDTLGGDFSKPVFSTTLRNPISSYSLTFNKIGSFKWNIRGNDGTDSTLDNSRTIYFKLTAPTPTGPLNGSTQTRPVNLGWDAVSNYSYLVYVYKADSVSNYDPTIYPYKTTGLFYPFNPSTVGTATYFWSVRTVDKYGNVSDESKRQKVIVQ